VHFGTRRARSLICHHPHMPRLDACVQCLGDKLTTRTYD
jgi:hypothetical protein